MIRDENFTVRVSEEERICLNGESERLGIPKSEVIRLALQLYFDEEANRDLKKKGVIKYGRNVR